jgi:hypothetical protein
MANDPGSRTPDATMDATSLYREEIYTDRKVGTLRVLSPVKTDGTPDARRRTVYQGEAQLMTNVGPLPISFDIDADNLSDAVAKYGARHRRRSCCRRQAQRSVPAARCLAEARSRFPDAGATLSAPPRDDAPQPGSARRAAQPGASSGATVVRPRTAVRESR